MLAQWDDHEVYNNWWPGEPLPTNEHGKPLQIEQRAAAGGAGEPGISRVHAAASGRG